MGPTFRVKFGDPADVDRIMMDACKVQQIYLTNPLRYVSQDRHILSLSLLMLAASRPLHCNAFLLRSLRLSSVRMTRMCTQGIIVVSARPRQEGIYFCIAKKKIGCKMKPKSRGLKYLKCVFSLSPQHESTTAHAPVGETETEYGQAEARCPFSILRKMTLDLTVSGVGYCLGPGWRRGDPPGPDARPCRFDSYSERLHLVVSARPAAAVCQLRSRPGAT